MRQRPAARTLLKLHCGSHPPSRSPTAHPRAAETWGFLQITCFRLHKASSSQVAIRDTWPGLETSTAVSGLIYLAPQQCQLTCLQDHHWYVTRWYPDPWRAPSEHPCTMSCRCSAREPECFCLWRIWRNKSSGHDESSFRITPVCSELSNLSLNFSCWL